MGCREGGRTGRAYRPRGPFGTSGMPPCKRVGSGTSPGGRGAPPDPAGPATEAVRAVHACPGPSPPPPPRGSNESLWMRYIECQVKGKGEAAGVGRVVGEYGEWHAPRVMGGRGQGGPVVPGNQRVPGTLGTADRAVDGLVRHCPARICGCNSNVYNLSVYGSSSGDPQDCSL